MLSWGRDEDTVIQDHKFGWWYIYMVDWRH
jgi:hypothetical protein